MSLKTIVLAALATAAIGCADARIHIRFRIDPRKETAAEAIARVKTPEQAQQYCNELGYRSDEYRYGHDDYWASFDQIHASQADDCDGGATAAISLLADDGYAPKVIVMWQASNPDYCHAISCYSETGKYGSCGINESDWRSAKHKTIDGLVESFRNYDCYKIIDFSDSMDEVLHAKDGFTSLYHYKSDRAREHHVKQDD